MKIASIADIHADQNNIEDTKIGMHNLLNVLDDEDVELLLVLGDVFHNFNIGGKDETFGSVFDSVNTPLNDFIHSKDKRKIIMIPGNHDMTTRKEAKDALTSFEYRERIHVSREIESFKVSQHVIVTTLPWMYPSMYSNREHLINKLMDLRSKSEGFVNILMGHCEIDGSEIASGYTMFGGHFNFTEKEIRSLGFDSVHLGHVHKQQFCYTGIPWQHSFGDEQLVGQIRVLDVSHRIESDLRVEIPHTPIYYNITVDEIDTFKKRKIDHVKVVGSKLIRDLPDGYKFEKAKETYNIVPRANVSCNDDISVLLEKWLKEKNMKADVDELVEILDEIDVDVSYGKKYGSLDEFINIRIEGIGSHKDTFMAFEDPIVAISGPNGVGKTIFMECLYAGLYGELPSYGKLSYLADENASLSVTFKTNNERYCVKRVVKKGKNTAFVYKGHETKPFMGPKVSEVNKFITQIVGPKELLLSSVFSTQIHAGDIVDLEPGNRKDIFHKLLGLGVFADMKEKVDDTLKTYKAKHDVLTNQASTFSTIKEMEERINDHSTYLISDRSALNLLEQGLERYVEKKANLDKAFATVDKKLSFKNLEFENLKAYRDELRGAQEQLKETEYIDVSKLHKDLKAKKEERDVESATFKENVAEMAKLLRLTNVHSEASSEHDACERGMHSFMVQHKLEVENYIEKASLLKDAGCNDDPLPCPFINGAAIAESALSNIKKQHQLDLDKWQKRVNKLFDAKEQARDEMDNSRVKEKDDTLYNKFNAECEEIRSTIDRYDAIQITRDALIRMTIDYSNKISDSKAVLETLKDESSEKLILIGNQIQTVDDSIGKAQVMITSRNVSIAEHRKELEFCKTELERLTEFDEQLHFLKTELPKLQILSEALSKNGIPQLIIDSALPQLQDILDILANFINKFNIKIKTQKSTNKGKGVKETIDFIVDDGIKARDVKFFSGGEKKLLKTLIRLSLSLFQSQRTGNSYKLLLMDETFDALDIDNSLLLLKIIYNLRTKFKQIFVISHSDDVLGRLSKCIKFKRKGNRTMIDG